jgi:hypothetical protein
MSAFFDAGTGIIHGEEIPREVSSSIYQFPAIGGICLQKQIVYRLCGHKSNNKQASPIELLVLGSLRYLGRGWTFDDVEENTAISKEVHRTFFHRFVELGSTVLYDKYVLTPDNVNEAKTHMREFEEAGFPGCVGSSDATHITTDRCGYNLKNNHLEPKSSLTARS